MAIQTVNTGTTPNDGTGDVARTAFTKINDNFTQPENAASRLVATDAEALAGASGVIPDANQVVTITAITTNVETATATIELDASKPIGSRWLVRKINATQGEITINCSGHTFTRAGLSSVTLNAGGDYWLMEKTSAGRIDLISGFNTGSNADGYWIMESSGLQSCFIDKTVVVDINIAIGPIFRSFTSALSGSYPAPFVVGSSITQSGQVVEDSSFDTWLGVDSSIGNEASYATSLISATTKTSHSIRATITATGRWYL